MRRVGSWPRIAAVGEWRVSRHAASQCGRVLTRVGGGRRGAGEARTAGQCTFGRSPCKDASHERHPRTPQMATDASSSWLGAIALPALAVVVVLAAGLIVVALGFRPSTEPPTLEIVAEERKGKKKRKEPQREKVRCPPIPRYPLLWLSADPVTRYLETGARPFYIAFFAVSAEAGQRSGSSRGRSQGEEDYRLQKVTRQVQRAR